ncbi:response regulator [Marivirga lumbricoides]|uniref:Response regulator n=1 Tax=Marivirga lumbricoides TaxID=1046115 RepID=A0ABQ1N870_9BACT|nr:response regulator [Marivirga lumbricoides]
MIQKGVIVTIEDDPDDKEIFEAIVRELGIDNEIKWFTETKSAFEFLRDTNDQIFLIFSDINLPGKDGISLKKDIDADPILRKKSIPFVFLSTTGSHMAVEKVYTEMTVQGFFVKGTDYEKMKNTLKTIFNYWLESKHPNSSN